MLNRDSTRYANGTWENTTTTQTADYGNLLDDDFDSIPDVDRLFEQGTVKASVIEAIEAAICSLYSGKSDHRAFALFGRYGQGKSRVIGGIKRQFHRKSIWTASGQIPVTVRQFSISHFKASDLEENFDLFFEYNRSIILIVMFLITVIAIAFAALSFAALEGYNENTLLVALLSTLTAFLAAGVLNTISSIRIFWRDILRRFRMDALTKEFLDNLIHLFNKPNLLIIDDLDRATIEQQKSLLQSLRRHKETMNCVVLLAFDEEPLVSAMHNTPSPTEILTKTFDASFRLAPLNGQDAVDMACAFTQQIQKLNEKCPYACRIRHPMIVGDLARIFFLHGNASARFAKKLVNTFYLDCRRMELDNIHDMSALLRMSGVFEYLPILESNLDFLAKTLSSSNDSAIVEAVEVRFGQELRGDRRAGLLRYLEGTRHMKPSHGVWERVLRSWRSMKPEPTPPFTPMSHVQLQHWASTDVYLALEADYPVKLAFLNDLMANPNKNHNYREFVQPSSVLIGPKLRKIWRGMVVRLAANDSELNEHLDDMDYRIWLKRYERHAPLIGAPPLTLALRSFRNTSIAETLRHHGAFSSIIPIDNMRLNFRLLKWKTTAQDEKIRDITGINRLEPEDIEQAWPDFHQADSPTALLHFKELSFVIRSFPLTKAISPAAHGIWARRGLERDLAEKVIEAFCLLLPNDINDTENGQWARNSILELLQIAFDIDSIGCQSNILIDRFVTALLRSLSGRPDRASQIWLLVLVCNAFDVGDSVLTETASLIALPRPERLLSKEATNWFDLLVDTASNSSQLAARMDGWIGNQTEHLPEPVLALISQLHQKVLLIHGLGSSPIAFGSLHKRLNRSSLITSLAVDLPKNMDELSKIPQNFDGDLFLQLASYHSEKLHDDDSIVLVGHSMGSAITIAMAEILGARVRAVVLIEGNLRASDCEMLSKKMTSRQFQHVIPNIIEQYRESKNVAWREWANTASCYSNDMLHNYAQAVLSASENDRLLERFERLPVARKLYIHGDGYARHFDDMTPQFSVKYIPGTDHFVMQDKPEKTAEAIKQCVWQRV